MTMKQWSTTAADNDDASTGIDWAEHQSPATINDSARQMMADAAVWYAQIVGGTNCIAAANVAGTGDAITLTTTDGIAAYAFGQRFVFIAEGTNTGATTVNVDSKGTRAVKQHGNALAGGEIVTGDIVVIMDDGTDYELIYPRRIPQITSIELGHATDTTLARASAGDVNIEGNIIYRAGGTDVPVTDGGTGASTAAAARTNLDVKRETFQTTLTASASASLSWTSLGSGARRIILRCDKLIPATDSVGLFLQVTQSGVAQSGSTDYSWCSRCYATVSGSTDKNDTQDAQIAIVENSGETIGDDASYGWTGEIVIEGPLETGFKGIKWHGGFRSPTAFYVWNSGAGVFIGNTNDIDGFQIAMSSGNIASGRIDVYTEY